MLSQLRRHFFSKQVYLFDLDGTLYLGKSVIPGARKLVSYLREQKKQIYFFTNNSSRSENDYVSKLRKLGFGAKASEVVMSTHSLIHFLKARRMKRVFLLGTPAMKKMLSRNSFVFESRPQIAIVGFDKTLTYEKLQKATRLIESGVPYVVTHPDLYCPTDKGREPDCGSIARMIELVTEVKPLAVLGKPHPLMMQIALDRCRAPKKDIILIGDRLSTDIEMAKAQGVQSLLVLSGETTRRMLSRSKVQPTYVVGSVQDLL
jgi:HAD superfamily hydrolase (TIGR01450 family)